MRRRKFIQTSAGFGSAMILSKKTLLNAETADRPDLAVVDQGEPDILVRTAIETLGGMSAFISKGDMVVVKPNISWDRVPKQGATTNPECAAEVVRLCLEAGAKTVKVFDNTLNEARRCYKRSGIAAAVKEAGGKIQYVQERHFKSADFPDGELIKSWEIHRDVLEADKIINVPCAKHHSISGVSLGMKNLMGLIGGVRGKLHRQFETKIVDLNTRIKPVLTVLDAYRILMRNGPSGGNPADVELKKMVIAGTDPVAIDSFGATLFGLNPEEIAFLQQAQQREIGKNNLSEVRIKRISLSI